MASKDSKKTELVFARVEPEMKKWVKKEARDRRVDQSDIVRDAIEEYREKRNSLKGGDHGVL